MSLLLTCLLLSAPIDSLGGVNGRDRWLSEDKFEHIFVSAFLVGTAYYLSRCEFKSTERKANQVAAGVSLSIGVSKELYDLAGGGNPSFKDILADVIGVVIGILIFT